jgi:predicted nucleic acid-binding protein
MQATHLADASALALLSRNDVAARLVPLIVGGGAATCAIVDLEVLNAFDRSDRGAVRIERSMFSRVPVDDAVLDRAIEVQLEIPGRMRIVALVVAAAAERAGLVLLHDDDAYEEIAAVTGQPTERAGP